MLKDHPLQTLIFNREHIVFLTLVAIYVAASFLMASAYGLGDRFSALIYMNYFAMVTVGIAMLYVFYLCLRAYWLLFKHRPAHPVAFLWNDLKEGPLNPRRYLTALPIFIGFLFFMSAFTSMKEMIPAIHPFAWDLRFIQLDQFLHFGVDPWRLLQPLLGNVYVLWFVNLVYNGWMLVLFIVLYWQVFSLEQRTRMQFFYTFILSWAINGTFLATWLSSAGPCYLERLNITDHYAPLMQSLSDADAKIGIFALTNQNWLWDMAQDGSGIPGGGISAMPSIHVAVAFLYMLLAFKLKARPMFLGAAIAFYALILTGSVVLGWHYAVDGYLATLTTGLIWWATGRAIPWCCPARR